MRTNLITSVPERILAPSVEPEMLHAPISLEASGEEENLSQTIHRPTRQGAPLLLSQQKPIRR